MNAKNLFTQLPSLLSLTLLDCNLMIIESFAGGALNGRAVSGSQAGVGCMK